MSSGLINIIIPILLAIALIFTGGGAQKVVIVEPETLLDNYADAEAIDKAESDVIIAALTARNSADALVDEFGSVYRREEYGDMVSEMLYFDTPYGRCCSLIYEDMHVYELGGKAYIQYMGETLTLEDGFIEESFGITGANSVFVYDETEVCLYRKIIGDEQILLTQVGDNYVEYVADGDYLIKSISMYEIDAAATTETAYMIFSHGLDVELPEWVKPGDVAYENPEDMFDEADALSAEAGRALLKEIDAANTEAILVEKYGSIVAISEEFNEQDAYFKTEYGLCMMSRAEDFEIYELNGKTYAKYEGNEVVLDEPSFTEENGYTPDDLLNTYTEDETCLYARADGDKFYALSEYELRGDLYRQLYITDASYLLSEVRIYMAKADGKFVWLQTRQKLFGVEIELPEWVIALVEAGETPPEGALWDVEQANDETALIAKYGSIYETITEQGVSMEIAAFNTDYGVAIMLKTNEMEIYQFGGATYVMYDNVVNVRQSEYLTEQIGLNIDDLINTYQPGEILLEQREQDGGMYLLTEFDATRQEYIINPDGLIIEARVFKPDSDGEHQLYAEIFIEHGVEIELPDWVMDHVAPIAEGEDNALKQLDAQLDELKLIEEYGSIRVSAEYDDRYEIFGFETERGVFLALLNSDEEIYQCDGTAYIKTGNVVSVRQMDYLGERYELRIDNMLYTYYDDEKIIENRAQDGGAFILTEFDYGGARLEYVLDENGLLTELRMFRKTEAGEFVLDAQMSVEYGAEIELPDWVLDHIE